MIPEPRTATEHIRSLFAAYGNKHYGEACTQTEHAISCAHHGQQLGFSEAIVVAALLHDIGHFVADHNNLPELDAWGYANHDSLGADYLKTLGFDDSVTEPIRLHVAAKRYLAATVMDRSLSAASRTTLEQQGGPMSPEECQHFQKNPWSDDALRLRQLDELGKPEHPINTQLEPWLAILEHHLEERTN